MALGLLSKLHTQIRRSQTRSRWWRLTTTTQATDGSITTPPAHAQQILPRFQREDSAKQLSPCSRGRRGGGRTADLASPRCPSARLLGATWEGMGTPTAFESASDCMLSHTHTHARFHSLASQYFRMSVTTQSNPCLLRQRISSWPDTCIGTYRPVNKPRPV